MKLEEAMVRNVATIAPEETIFAAAQRMLDLSVGSLIVTVDGGLKGIVTDRDLLRCVAAAHDPKLCHLSTHMSRPVVTERPDEDLLVAADVMRREGVKRLPVIQDGRVVGIVSFSDISRVTHEVAKTFWSSGVAVTTLVRAMALYKSRQKEGYIAQ
jgi:CBS domain-containing protein